ncbi:hypothetical protein C6C15_05845 [Microbacterium sp. str. 'China']|nr:hypothetical protein C6C15_05845 [Microbacterium sp. str. 'China']
MRTVGPEERRELHGRGRAGDEEDGDRGRGRCLVRCERDPLVGQRLAQPPLGAGVGEPERGDPGGARADGLVLQGRFEDGQ